MDPLFDFSGKVALVTGGASGLGYGMARALASYGADVAISARTASACAAVAAEISEATGRRVIGIPCDVNDNGKLQDMVNEVVSQLGGIDIAIANAGTAATNAALKFEEDEWDEVIRTDLRSVFFTDQYVARVMVEQGRGGRIINLASAAGLVGNKGVVSYCAAKAGVVNMTRTLALEWGRYGITVNALCPSYVETEMNKMVMEIPKVRDAIFAATPFRRLGKVEEVAAAALYLASDFSGYTTGITLLVDGGSTAQ